MTCRRHYSPESTDGCLSGLRGRCWWESGQDVSSRFGPQQTGGTIIQHVRPVDLQASMAQAAEIMVHWSKFLAQDTSDTTLNYTDDGTYWQNVANDFTVKTRLMWQDGWFRDYDAVAKEWSNPQVAMHLAPGFF